MNKKKIKEFEKKYDKFKDNNLPTSFWDEERQTKEYVYFNDNKLIINPSLFEALGDIALSGCYYSFTSGYMTGNINEGLRYEVGHNHAHSFEEVVLWLYDYPESFSISKDEEQYYSKQELEYLRDVKKYLLFIGMKDCKKTKRPINRYKNKKQEKYKDYLIKRCSDKVKDKILNGELNFFFYHTTQPDYYKDHREFAKNERISLLRDEEGNFFAMIEFTHQEKTTYKEFKKIFQDLFNDIMTNYYTKEELKDDDCIIIEHFRVIKKY